MSLYMFLCPYISCKQVVSSRVLGRIRFDFLAKRVELFREKNEVTKSKSGGFRKEDTSLASPGSPLDLQVGDKEGAPQTSIRLTSGMLRCWEVSSYLTFHRGPLGPSDPTIGSSGADQQLALATNGSF